MQPGQQYNPGPPVVRPPPLNGMSSGTIILLVLVILFVVVPVASCVSCMFCGAFIGASSEGVEETSSPMPPYQPPLKTYHAHRSHCGR